MKILMVISQFYPIIGGAEKQAQLLAQTLIENSASMRDEKSILIGTVWIDQIEDLGALRERMRRGRC